MPDPADRASAGRPRVLVLPSSYFAHDRTVGGGERYALRYASALAAETPTTLALFGPEPATHHDGALEVRTFSSRTVDPRALAPLTGETLRAMREFDVLHLMIFPTPVTDLLIPLARLRGQTVVLTDVGGGIPGVSTHLQRIHPRLSISRLAHGLAHLSRHSAAQFGGWSQPSTILYGGADVPTVGPEETEAGGYALYVGRLLPHKGVLQLIEAIAPDTPLHVVGRVYDAEYFARLEAAARGKNVRFVLDADDEELRRQYLGASVVLQPSIPVREGPSDTSELLGLVTLEGMAHGKPVIVTRTASLPELVRDGETGFIVPPNDPGPLRDRVERLVSDAALRRRMGERARRHVQENFTWAEVARRGLELYDRLRAPAA